MLYSIFMGKFVWGTSDHFAVSLSHENDKAKAPLCDKLFDWISLTENRGDKVHPTNRIFVRRSIALDLTWTIHLLSTSLLIMNLTSLTRPRIYWLILVSHRPYHLSCTSSTSLCEDLSGTATCWRWTYLEISSSGVMDLSSSR